MSAAHRAVEAILTLLQMGPMTLVAVRSRRMAYWRVPYSGNVPGQLGAAVTSLPSGLRLAGSYLIIDDDVKQ